MVVEPHGILDLDTFVPQVESDHDAHPVQSCHTQRKCHTESARLKPGFSSHGAVYLVVSRQYYEASDLVLTLECHYAPSGAHSSEHFLTLKNFESHTSEVVIHPSPASDLPSGQFQFEQAVQVTGTYSTTFHVESSFSGLLFEFSLNLTVDGIVLFSLEF